MYWIFWFFSLFLCLMAIQYNRIHIKKWKFLQGEGRQRAGTYLLEKSRAILIKTGAYHITLFGHTPVKVYSWPPKSCIHRLSLPSITSCWNSAIKGFFFFSLCEMIEREVRLHKVHVWLTLDAMFMRKLYVHLTAYKQP